MSSAIGSLLLLWAEIERAAREEVFRTHRCVPKSAHGIASLLRTWEASVVANPLPATLHTLLAATLRAQLQKPLDVRNGVCHGLVGISSAHGGSLAALSWELNGDLHSITWVDLQTTLNWLSKIPDAISIISAAESDHRANRMIDSPENREWWLKEFAIALPD